MWAVLAVAVPIVAWAVPGALRFIPNAPAEFWAMTLLALLVDAQLFNVARREGLRVRSTLSVCFTFAIFALWGLAPAIIVQAVAAVVVAVGQRRPFTIGALVNGRLICGLAVAGLVVGAIDDTPITTAGSPLDGGDVSAFLALATVGLGVNFSLLVLSRSALEKQPLRQTASQLKENMLSTVALVLLVAPLLTAISGWWCLLVAVPLIAWNELFRSIAHNQERMRLEPGSGVLSRLGLAVGLERLTSYDYTDRQERPFGIVLVDVESVLTITSMLGRDVLDGLMRQAARRISNAYGSGHVARPSGEGFAILIPDLTEDRAFAAARSAAAVLEPPVIFDGVPFSLEPAAGVALSPQHGRDLTTLLVKAELAVDAARRRGESAAVYVPATAYGVLHRLDLLRDLRAALADPGRRAEIGVVFQPQVYIASGALSGVEALVRWHHPEWGLIPPDDLIEAVEQSAVMHQLTLHVLDSVAAQLRAWNEEGFRVRASVNVSVRDLHDPRFASELADVSATHGIPVSQLMVEVTERMLIDHETPFVYRAATEIARLGAGVSLDDFGAGHASLLQLQDLPLTQVKLDKAYVGASSSSERNLAVLRSVHELARALQVEMVVEGIEDELTAAALAQLPEVVGQGWYFGGPEPAEAVLAAWQRR